MMSGHIWRCAQACSAGYDFPILKLNIAGLEIWSQGELTLLTSLGCAIWVLLNPELKTIND